MAMADRRYAQTKRWDMLSWRADGYHDWGYLESTHQNGDDLGMDIGFTTKSVWKTWMWIGIEILVDRSAMFIDTKKKSGNQHNHPPT